MSAPPQGLGGGGGGSSDLNPTTFLGTYSGTNPSSPANNSWWYRVDTGELWMNVNGTIMPVQNTGNVTVIASNTTIANTDVWNDIIVLNGVTLTIYGTIVFHGNVTVLNGGTLLSSNPSASSSSTQTNNYSFLGSFHLNGTYSIAQYNVDSINASVTIDSIVAESESGTTITGSGTLSIPSGITLTIKTVTTLSVSSLSGTGAISLTGWGLTIYNNYTLSSSTPQFTGSGNIQINSGYTITLNVSATWTLGIVTGSGTLSIGSGYTLTVGGNATYSVPTITGSGTLAVASGYTLTAGGAITISVANVSVAGTFNTNGQTLTIPSGTTVSWKTTGSISGSGTLTVNGAFYYYGISLGTSTGVPSAPWSLNGTGVGLFTSNNSSSGGGSASFSSTAISPGGYAGGASTSGIAPRVTLSSIEGSATGNYGLYTGVYSSFYQELLVYIGTANTAYSVNFTGVATSSDASGNTAYLYNSSSSAGTITISGTMYA